VLYFHLFSLHRQEVKHDIKGLIQLLVNPSAMVKWRNQSGRLKPMKLTMYEISLGDQQTTNPQQTITDVTAALRSALFIPALSIEVT